MKKLVLPTFLRYSDNLLIYGLRKTINSKIYLDDNLSICLNLFLPKIRFAIIDEKEQFRKF